MKEWYKAVKKDFSQRTIFFMSMIIVILCFGYFLVYPLVLGFFNKKEADISLQGTIIIDKSNILKIESLKDNTIHAGEDYDFINETIPSPKESLEP